MNKTVERCGSNHETNEKNNITAQELQEYSNLIRQRAQFYKEENRKMEEIFRKLKLLSGEHKLLGLGKSVENLEKIKTELEAKSLSSGNAAISQAEKLRKKNNYLSKLKICVRHYTNLNNAISKEIKSLKCDSEQSKQSVTNILKLSTNDIQQLEEKAKNYENELTKFEKKNPWLKNPEYDLQNISKYIQTLNSLKEEKDSLVKELSVYKNLKPDIKEAKQQLADVKDQIKSQMSSFKI